MGNVTNSVGKIGAQVTPARRIRLEFADLTPEWHFGCFSEVDIKAFKAARIVHVLLDLDGCITPAYHHDEIDEHALPVIRDMCDMFETVSLATNNECNLDRIVGKLGLHYAFQPYAEDGTWLGYKPEPEYFDRILAELGARHDPSTVLLVGDTPEHDIIGAHAMGMQAALVDRLDPYEFFDNYA